MCVIYMQKTVCSHGIKDVEPSYLLLSINCFMEVVSLCTIKALPYAGMNRSLIRAGDGKLSPPFLKDICKSIPFFIEVW